MENDNPAKDNIDQLEDGGLLAEAEKRTKNIKDSDLVPESEVMRGLGISEGDLKEDDNLTNRPKVKLRDELLYIKKEHQTDNPSYTSGEVDTESSEDEKYLGYVIAKLLEAEESIKAGFPLLSGEEVFDQLSKKHGLDKSK